MPLRESSLQKRSGMARILKGSHRYLHTHMFIARWPGQRTNLGMIPGLCAKVRSSEFRRVCYRINILGSQLSPSSMVPAQAEKVTVGLASHWPCVTDTVVYPPTGSTAKDREMSIHAYAHSGRGTIYQFTTRSSAIGMPLPSQL